ncbi:MAG: response regulator [Thermoflexales bacterium]|nr:response regulator [Thermoflexales bacterium]
MTAVHDGENQGYSYSSFSLKDLGPWPKSRYALIVEDLPAWQETLHEVLIDAGCQVWVASSYAEAIALLAQREFHLAVIDPVLDDTNSHNRDGLRVLRRLLDEHPAVRAIVITSSDPNHIRREVHEMDASVPVLWKDEWDDEQFLALVRDMWEAP